MTLLFGISIFIQTSVWIIINQPVYPLLTSFPQADESVDVQASGIRCLDGKSTFHFLILPTWFDKLNLKKEVIFITSLVLVYLLLNNCKSKIAFEMINIKVKS